MPDLDTAKEREWIASCREDFEVGVSLQRATRYLDAVDERDALLQQIREEIGAAWFADGVGIVDALRRKTRALERLLNGVALPGGGS